MKIAFSTLLVVFSLINFASAQTSKVKATDLRGLIGAKWSGKLTYLDYQSKSKVTIDSDLIVTRSTENKASYIFDYQYPKEPKANSKKTVTISADGKIIDGEAVIERTVLNDKTLKIVTQKDGADDNRKATFRYTYLLSANGFSIKKEIKFADSPDYFERNEYSWKR